MNFWRWLAPLALCLAGQAAHATLSCSIAAPAPVAFAYVANTGTGSAANVQQGSISVSCTRTASGDTTSLALAASAGLYPASKESNVQLIAGGTSYRVSYNLYKDSACSIPWGSNSSDRLSATLPSTLNIPLTVSFTYWACKTTAQALTSYPSGLYTDRVDLTLYASGLAAMSPASINVNMYAPALCTLSNGPGNLNFSYKAFSATAAVASTSFKANCSNLLPYTMTVSPTSGVVSGLRYSLGLNLSQVGTATNPGSVSLSTQGNALGSATHYITGAMEAGQPGQSGTMVPQVHTLTLSY